MRLKITIIFLLSILIPTALLAYFGLQAVKSEKLILESSIRQRYEAMANIVEDEVTSTIAGLLQDFLKNKNMLESIIIEQASIFKDQVAVSDKKGIVLGGGSGNMDRGQLMVSRHMKSLPYTISVYERYPLILERYGNRKKALYAYILIIGASAVAILGGSIFTLNALSRQWDLAELKSQFVSGLSHDLRTPLTSIRMFSEMLNNKLVPTEEKKLEYYKAINTESERLTQLANNILDFSRMESGRKKYRLKDEDIGKVVKETIDYFVSYNIDEPRLIDVSIQEGLPPIKIDASTISQAVLNLLSNAVKYSPNDKKIKVNVSMNRSDILIEVIDEGVGIPSSEHKKVFHKFYRVRRSDSDIAGSGLGLALVKYAAEIHGGRVAVESEIGKGSKFSMVLPL